MKAASGCAALLALAACGGAGQGSGADTAAPKRASSSSPASLASANKLIAAYQPFKHTSSSAPAPGVFTKASGATWQWRVQLGAIAASAAKSLAVGQLLTLDLPDGSAVPLQVVRAEQVIAGTWSIVAHGLDASQAAHAVLSVTDVRAISGVLSFSPLANSPREWLFETSRDGITVTDSAASGRVEQPFHSRSAFAAVEKSSRDDGGVSIGLDLPLLRLADQVKQARLPSAAALPLVPQGALAFAKGSPIAALEVGYLSERFAKQALQFKAGGATLDMLVAVDTTALAIYGSVEAMNADIATAIMLTNDALVASKVDGQVRLAKLWVMLESLDGYTQSDILASMRNGVRAFSGMWKEQVLAGADVAMTVVAYRDIDVDAGNCGLAFLNRFAQGGSFQSARNGYGVTSRPRQTQATSSCSPYTFVHELGHTLGNAHDRANADSAGAFAYSYGHGVVGLFGDIMAYTRPRFGVFSNPDLQCAGQPCGVPETDLENAADASKTLRQTIAPAATGQDAQSQLTGWYWTPPGGTGWAVEVKNGRLFAAVFLYDDAGAPVWYAGSGALCGALRYCLDLSEFKDGQTANGAFRTAAVKRKVATTTLQFTEGFPAGLTATVDGKVWALQRFWFDAAAFVKRPQFTGMPYPGWYWDSTQPGTGVFIEYQGDQMFAGYFHYGADGSAQWVVSLGRPYTATLNDFGIVTTSAAARVQWASYAGGQTLLGEFRRASTVDAAVYSGFVQPHIDFLSVGNADGTRTTRALTRFRDF